MNMTTQNSNMITKDASSNTIYDNYIIPSSTLLQPMDTIYSTHSTNDIWPLYAETQSPNQTMNCATSQQIQTYDFYYSTIKNQSMTDNMCNTLFQPPSIIDPNMIYDQSTSSPSSSSPSSSSCSISSSPLLISNDDHTTLPSHSQLLLNHQHDNNHNNNNEDIFHHLSKAQLIERVVQLEQEKRQTSNNKKASSSTSVALPKKKKNTDEYPIQEQGVHICRWLNCRTETSTLDELIIHLRDVHIGSGKAAYYCDWIGCTRNRKPFMKRHKMHNHMRTHTGERPFVCNVSGCEKRFSRPDSLNTHIRTHSNIRPYLCPLEGCNKAYFHSRSLRKHVKGHEAAGIMIAKPKRNVSTKKSSISSTSTTSSLSTVSTSSNMNHKIESIQINNHHPTTTTMTPLIIKKDDYYFSDTQQHYQQQSFVPTSPFIDSSSSSSSSSIMSIHTPTISSFDLSQQNLITSPLYHPTTSNAYIPSSSPISSQPMLYDTSSSTSDNYTYVLSHPSSLL
ncbi:unnamed protein product [Cunninghamella blakesleeana]